MGFVSLYTFLIFSFFAILQPEERRRAYQSSRLRGKYSYSMSSVSMGLACGLWHPAPLLWPCPVNPDALLESSIADVFVRWGLCALSFELERFAGLRSSSDRERLIGSGCGPVVLLLRWVLRFDGGFDLLLPACLGCIDDGASNDPHEGTGGRFITGEDMAIFLVACCWLGVVEGYGVAQSDGDCFNLLAGTREEEIAHLPERSPLCCIAASFAPDPHRLVFAVVLAPPRHLIRPYSSSPTASYLQAAPPCDYQNSLGCVPSQ